MLYSNTLPLKRCVYFSVQLQLSTEICINLKLFLRNTDKRICEKLMGETIQEKCKLEADLSAQEHKHAGAIPNYDVTSTVQKNRNWSASVVNEVASEIPLPNNKTILVQLKTSPSTVEIDNSPSSSPASSVKRTNPRKLPSSTNESTTAGSDIDSSPSITGVGKLRPASSFFIE